MSGPICSGGRMRRGPVLLVVSWASPDRVRTPFEASMPTPTRICQDRNRHAPDTAFLIGLGSRRAVIPNVRVHAPTKEDVRWGLASSSKAFLASSP